MNKLLTLGLVFALSVSILLGSAEAAFAAAIRNNPGFSTNTLAPNDDDSTGLVDMGFMVDFFGVVTNQLYVNNNGNITFDMPLGVFTPFDLTSTGRKIIAPFFADVDTRVSGTSDPVKYGTDTVNGRPAFGVNWINVDCFATDLTAPNGFNSFQLVLIDRSDTGAKNFDIEFNYDMVNWESGLLSGGDIQCLGGSSARVGYSAGTGVPDTFFELAGSAIPGAFLDSNLDDGLIHNSLNSQVLGRYVFEVRNGMIDPSPKPIGGTVLSVDSTALVMAGISNPYSIMGILAIIGVGSFGTLYLSSRRKN